MNLSSTLLLSLLTGLTVLGASPASAASRSTRQEGSEAARREPRRTEQDGADETGEDESGEVVSGLRGFTTLSTVVFDAAPEAPHRFETNYIFPDRARWWLSYESAESGYRRAEYRHGERVFGFSAGTSRSDELTGLDRAATIRRMELRRALFLWPDGFEWRRDGETTRARLPDLAEDEESGQLLARTDAEGRPESIAVLTPEGEEQETLTVLEQTERAGRTWPRSIRLSVGSEKVWTETVEEVDPSRRYVDSFFVPVDRRSGPAPGPQANSDTPIRQIDLPVFAFKAIELPEEVDWHEALRRGDEEWKRESERLVRIGRELDPVVRFEIEARGRPTFVLLHLLEADPTPKGWKRTEARTGLMLVLDGREQLSRSRVEGLLQAIPVGSRPTPAYVRPVGGPESRRVQLVLPLVPQE